MIEALLLELTPRCDRRCAHCYNVWKHDGSTVKAALPWSELEEVVKTALDKFGCRTATLIGGEPFLYPDLFEAAKFLSPRVELALSTHGGLIGTQEADHLARAGVRAVEVSMCADSGDGSSLPLACRAIASVSAVGIACTASAVLARPFLPYLVEIAERALAFGARGLALQPLVEPRPGAIVDELVASDEEWWRATELLDKWAAARAFPVIISNLFAEERVPQSLRSRLSSPCSCVSSKRVVDPWGRFRRCESHPGSSGQKRRSGGDCPLLATR